MGNILANQGDGNAPDKDDKKKKRRVIPPSSSKLKRHQKPPGADVSSKLPTVRPKRQCLLRMTRFSRLVDWLLMEEELLQRQGVRAGQRDADRKKVDERVAIDNLRGSPISAGKVLEMFDNDHLIVTLEGMRREWYVPVLSIVDKERLSVDCTVLVKVGGGSKTTPLAVVGLLDRDADQQTTGFKVTRAPTETFEDIGGLEAQIQELKETVELPLTHPELYEDIGIRPPKGVILYGAPGTGKTLLAKAVANRTNATFIRASGSDLVQKYRGDGPRLVRELFRMAEDYAPSIMFIDEVDAIGTKRYDTSCSGEKEIQRTLLELLTQLDGFDARPDVRIIMATNRIDTLDPALIRPGRIDRKIEIDLPDEHTKKRIFDIYTATMKLAEEVTYDRVFTKADEMSGAEVRSVCTEAGMKALDEHRCRVLSRDFELAVKTIVAGRKPNHPENIYL